MKKISFYTLGCKLNQAETSALIQAAKDAKYTVVPFDEPSDVMVVNSCTVTRRADRKTRQALYQAKTLSPKGILILAGCYPQIKAEKSIQIKGVDIVLGTRDKFNFLEAIDEFEKSGEKILRVSPVDNQERLSSAFIAATDRTRAFLKVQEGCNNYCTYCIIPHARGNSVSRDFDNTIKEAKSLTALGFKEIVLSGIDIGAYQDKDKKLIDLIKALEKVDGLERIRISSIEMNTFTDELIKHIGKSKKVMPHFHLSLQSGSDTILKNMGRKYLREDFKKKVETIRKHIPSASIGTDIIVGFPGENDALFCETVDFINEINFSYLHVFRYSQREGTPAASMKSQVPEQGKKARAGILEDTHKQLQETFAQKFIDSRQAVLWERWEEGFLYGHTPHFVEVKIETDEDKHNTISKIVIDKNHLVF